MEGLVRRPHKLHRIHSLGTYMTLLLCVLQRRRAKASRLAVAWGTTKIRFSPAFNLNTCCVSTPVLDREREPSWVSLSNVMTVWSLEPWYSASPSNETTCTNQRNRHMGKKEDRSRERLLVIGAKERAKTVHT